jgi:hypothetical protein
MKPECSLPFSQEPASASHSEPDESRLRHVPNVKLACQLQHTRLRILHIWRRGTSYVVVLSSCPSFS